MAGQLDSIIKHSRHVDMSALHSGVDSTPELGLVTPAAVAAQGCAGAPAAMHLLVFMITSCLALGYLWAAFGFLDLAELLLWYTNLGHLVQEAARCAMCADCGAARPAG